MMGRVTRPLLAAAGGEREGGLRWWVAWPQSTQREGNRRGVRPWRGGGGEGRQVRQAAGHRGGRWLVTHDRPRETQGRRAERARVTYYRFERSRIEGRESGHTVHIHRLANGKQKKGGEETHTWCPYIPNNDNKPEGERSVRRKRNPAF